MSRSSKHTETQMARLEFGDATLEIGVVIGFTFHPAVPATPPSYASGGDPPEGPATDIDSIAFKIDGKPVILPDQVATWLTENIDHDALCEVANDERAGDADAAAEARADELRDEPRYLDERFYPEDL